MNSAIRFLALGDSYTIGTGASDESHGWPALLAARLTDHSGRKVELTNPAANGFTTQDLIEKELPLLARVKPHLVTILIGVNDMVRGRSAVEYRASLESIYDEIVRQRAPDARVAAVSIPNWSVVPAVRDFGDPGDIGLLTDAFNDVAQQESEIRGFSWVDITAASVSGLGSAGWIAPDGLHPGDRQYAAWAAVIWFHVRQSWGDAEA